jgi:RHS repeat-associated protein
MYYSDNWQVIEEHQYEEEAWLLHKQFVWGIRYIDELVLRDQDTSSPINGTLNQRHYALQDANFNVVAIVGSTGSVVRRFEYDAYGHSTTLEADYTPGAYEYDFEYRYAGYRWDYETHLLQVRNRWYHPRLCRWLSRDPIGYVDGMSLYAYVRGQPISANDPSGLLRCCCNKPIVPTNKSGSKPTVVPTKGVVKVYGKNHYTAEFTNKGDCSCSCCAMEVWVRGYVHFIVGETVVKVPHTLPGSGQPLDENEYRQDSPRIRPTKCKIDKTDYPGLTSPARTWGILRGRNDVQIEVHYDFEVYTVDTCNNNERINTYEFHWWLIGTPLNPAISTDLAPS